MATLFDLNTYLTWSSYYDSTVMLVFSSEISNSFVDKSYWNLYVNGTEVPIENASKDSNSQLMNYPVWDNYFKITSSVTLNPTDIVEIRYEIPASGQPGGLEFINSKAGPGAPLAGSVGGEWVAKVINNPYNMSTYANAVTAVIDSNTNMIMNVIVDTGYFGKNLPIINTGDYIFGSGYFPTPNAPFTLAYNEPGSFYYAELLPAGVDQTVRGNISSQFWMGSLVDPSFFELLQHWLPDANAQSLITRVTLNNSSVGMMGNDLLIGSMGNNSLTGGSGNDLLIGDEIYSSQTLGGTDLLSGGDGNDIIYGGGGSDNLAGDVGSDNLNGGAGNDNINGGSGSDTISGGAGNDVINGGGTGAPIALAGIALQSASLLGSTQAYNVDVNTVVYSGNRSEYSIVLNQNGAWTVTDLVSGRDGVDTLTNIQRLQFTDQFFLLPNIINGTSNNDTLVGTEDNDIINGLRGIDTITGSAGSDTLLGGEGNDIYIVAASSEHLAAEIQDSAGTADVVRFTSTTANDTLTLYAGDTGIEQVVIGTSAGVTTGTTALNVDASLVTSVLSISGNAGANILSGNGANNTLNGGAGADTMIGGAGNDTYVVDNVGDTVTELNGEGTDTVQLALSTQTYISYGMADFIENITFTGTGPVGLIGNALANTITGNAENNLIYGGAGADTMIGGAGNDTYYVDNVGDVITEVANGGTGDGVYSTLTTYTLGATLESLFFDGTTSSNLTFTGNALANIISTSDGNDIITGLGGVDIMLGRNGSDIYIMTLASDHTAAEINDDGASGTDEVRFTSTTAGTLTLYAGDIGIETVVIGTGTGASAITTGTIANNVNAALVTNALSITGNNGNNTLTGTGFADTLIGNAGNDTLIGGGGNDSLTGGVGLDTFNVTAGTDTVADLGQGGVDILNVSAGATANATIHTAWTASKTTVNRGTANITTNGLAVNLSAVTTAGTNGFNVTNTGSATTLTGSGLNDTLVGGTGNDTLIGNAGNDTLTGNAGDDILNGGVGADTMNGGEGSDIYLIGLLAEYATGEVIADTGSTGTDELRFATTAASTLTLANTLAGIENIVIGTGTAASAISTATTAINVNASALTYGVSMTGNNGANILTGTGFADTLTGNLGNDTLIGGGGNDRLIGGVGADSLTGGLGSDTFVFTTGDTGITATTIDTIQDYAKGNVGTGDLIDYSSNLTIGGSATTATATSASIHQTTGEATFAAGSGTTLADALADISTSFTAATNTQGDFAFFRVNNAGNLYMFISDGAAGLGANDVVVQLVGITSINGIDLTNGDLTLLS